MLDFDDPQPLPSSKKLGEIPQAPPLKLQTPSKPEPEKKLQVPLEKPLTAPVEIAPTAAALASNEIFNETLVVVKPQRPIELASSLNPVTIGNKNKPHADAIRIIGGKNYDVRQPVPIKYPSVREHFLNARNNFWTPHEIPMGDDKVQWNTGVLSEEEIWLFKCNISYLTASDNLVPDNLDNAILEQITASEMRQYLRWQIAEESNHIESYFFILESFGLDEKGQGQIFSLYQDVPELVNKLNWNLNFTNKVVNCEHPPASKEANRALLEDLISYYVFEYLFFPLGFSQVFALARQGKLRNTAQQYQYIWRDENLHAINERWLILQIIKENPELWDATMQEQARSIVNEAVQLETAFGKATMPNGGISGLSVQSYTEYAQLMGDNLLKSLNLKPLFNIKEHPMPWLAEYEMKQEVNFFEGRVRDYRIGSALDWG